MKRPSLKELAHLAKTAPIGSRLKWQSRLRDAVTKKLKAELKRAKSK